MQRKEIDFSLVRELLAQGWTRKSIARTIGVSERTLRRHMKERKGEDANKPVNIQKPLEQKEKHKKDHKNRDINLSMFDDFENDMNSKSEME